MKYQRPYLLLQLAILLFYALSPKKPKVATSIVFIHKKPAEAGHFFKKPH